MSGSLASLGKALHATFAQQRITLPPELLQVVETYLEKHQEPSENDSQRLHEELCSVHKQCVNGTDKNAAFLHILRLLRHQMIVDADQCEYWWEAMIGPIIGNPEQTKLTLKDAKDICLDMMIPPEDDADFKRRNATAERIKRCMLDAYFSAQRSQLDNVAVNLEICLVAYARRRTKDFFETIDPHLQDKQNRLQCLTLLSTFVRLQTQYIYTCYETPLLNSLLSCLEQDTSTSVISLALTILIMMLPHIPDRLGQMLPRCFQVFGRILCWDRIGAVQRRTAAMLVETAETEGETAPEAVTEDSGAWQRLEASFDIVHSTPPKSAQYFTFLYGLYPINFLDYLRAPSLYLKAHNFEADASLQDVFDDETIKSRAEPLARRHLLHPNLSALTLESEVSDASRWMKMEPSDVVTLCISLDTINIDTQSRLQTYRGTEPDDDVTPVSLDVLKSPPAEDKSLSPIEEQEDEAPANLSMMESFMSGDSAEIAPAASRLASPAFLPTQVRTAQSGSESMTRRESGKRQALNPADVLRVHEQLLDVHPSMLDDTSQADISYYQREVLLLRNELHFERHLKQQHLQHIGRLQRSNMADAAVETERQNLYNTTKALKSQVANLQAALQRQRNETNTSKANRLDYEASLNERIKQLRQERSVWTSTEKSMRIALEEARADVQGMRHSLGVAEGKQLNLRQQLQVLEPEIQETRDLKQNIDLLKQRMKEAEVQDIQLRMEKERVAEAVARAKASDLALEAVKAEFAMYRQEQEDGQTEASTVVALKSSAKPELIASMLAHAKSQQKIELDQITKRHATLRKQYTSLESHLEEVQAKLQVAELQAHHALEREKQLQAERKGPSVMGAISSQSPDSPASGLGRSERSDSIASVSTSGTVDVSMVHGARRRTLPASVMAAGGNSHGVGNGNENVGPTEGLRTVSSMTLPSRHQTTPLSTGGERSPALPGSENQQQQGYFTGSSPSLASRSTTSTGQDKAKQPKPVRTPMPISMYGPLVPPKTKTAPAALASEGSVADSAAAGSSGAPKKAELKIFSGRFSRWS